MCYLHNDFYLLIVTQNSGYALKFYTCWCLYILYVTNAESDTKVRCINMDFD